MRIAHLRYFVDAADLQSIKLAAEKNCISPQGISRAVRNLELVTGCQLFSRGANNVSLTQCGYALLPYARQVVSDYDTLMRENRKLNGESSSSPLTIYCCTFFFVMGLLPLLQKGLNGFKGGGKVEARIIQMHTDSILNTIALTSKNEDANNRSLSFLLFFDSLAEENHYKLKKLRDCGITYKPILRYHDYLLVSSRRLDELSIGNQDKIDRSMLSLIPVISSSGEQKRALEQYMGSPLELCVEDMNSRISLVKEQQGGILIPPFVDVGFEAGLEIRELKSPYTVELGVAGLPEVLDDPAVFSLLCALNYHFRTAADRNLCRLLLQ